MLGLDFICSPLIKNLPEGIKLLALMNQVEKGNKPNENLKLIECELGGNFLWQTSNEGFDYWQKVYYAYRLKEE